MAAIWRVGSSPTIRIYSNMVKLVDTAIHINSKLELEVLTQQNQKLYNVNVTKSGDG